MDYYSFTDPGGMGWKAEMVWLDDPQRTLFPQSGHLSTTDEA